MERLAPPIDRPRPVEPAARRRSAADSLGVSPAPLVGRLPFPPHAGYTAYGDEAAIPPVRDVIGFARWRREVMHL
jgi:hypothetical protein